MKKAFFPFIIILLLNFFQQSSGAYLHNFPKVIKQPDGSEISCYVSGDEYFNWLHDANGFTIIQSDDGWYYYAVRVGDKLKPSVYPVNSIDPASAGLQPRALISAQEYHLKRKLHSSNMKNSAKTPTSGTINNIVIFIRFNNETEYTDLNLTYSNMFNSVASGANSQKNYFKEASYNQLTISSSFYPTTAGSTVVSYPDAHTRNYYQPYNATTNPSGYADDATATAREHTLLKNAVNAIASQVPTSLNIDGDNDGYVDNICFIVKGDPDSWNDLLWPHMWSLFSYNVYINSKEVGPYNFQLQNSLLSDGVGVLCHEMFHSIGAPDLYHYDSGFGDLHPVAEWDVMEYDMNPPQHMGAYMKYRYGNWMSTITVITNPGQYTLNPLNSVTATNVAYKIPSPNSASEYFVVEYRNTSGTFESSLPGSGMIIYRINTDFDGMGNADYDGSMVLDEVYVYRPNGTLSNNGASDDAFFCLDAGRTVFNTTSNPSCFLSDGTPGGINISDITSAAGTITFTLNSSSAPVVTTSNATNITTSGVILNGIINACSQNTIVSFQYGLTTAYGNTVTASPALVSGNQNTPVTATLSGLLAGTCYHFRLKAVSALWTVYGNDMSFITQCNISMLPLNENFEGTFLPTCWTLNNTDGSITWAKADSVQGNPPGISCTFLNNFDYNSISQSDELIAPPFYLDPDVVLSFKVAYRRYSAIYSDTLKIYISTNGGTSYLPTPLYCKGGSLLSTGSDMTSEFFPASANDWRTDSVDLSAFSGNNVSVKFVAINGYGNNLFLDDINIAVDVINNIWLNISGNNISCYGNSDGTAILTVTGGTGPYTYIWSNGATSQNLSNLPGGVYTVTVTSSNSVMANASVIITQPSQIYIDIFSDNVGCYGENDGSIYVIPGGGIQPYSFHWNNGSTNQQINALSAGYYSLTITDENLCTMSAGTSITQPPQMILSFQVTNPVDNINGSIDMTVNGGTSPYAFQWSNGASTEDISGLPQGTYIVVVTDANICISTASVYLTNQTGIEYADISGNDALLYQNIPNPASFSTVISFNLPYSQNVCLTIYNILGEKTETLISGLLTAGEHIVICQTENYTSGTYFYILKTPYGSQTKMMQVLR